MCAFRLRNRYLSRLGAQVRTPTPPHTHRHACSDDSRVGFTAAVKPNLSFHWGCCLLLIHLLFCASSCQTTALPICHHLPTGVFWNDALHPSSLPPHALCLQKCMHWKKKGVLPKCPLSKKCCHTLRTHSVSEFNLHWHYLYTYLKFRRYFHWYHWEEVICSRFT